MNQDGAGADLVGGGQCARQGISEQGSAQPGAAFVAVDRQPGEQDDANRVSCEAFGDPSGGFRPMDRTC